MQSLWMIVASFFFASMGVCVKLASTRFSTAEIIFYRSLVALLFIYCLVRTRGIPIRTLNWRFQLWRGISGTVSLMLYFYAVSMLPLATAVTLAYTAPLFLGLYMAFFGKTRMGVSMSAALVLGFVGVALLLQPTFQSDQLLGGVIGLCSGVMTALAYINVRELGARGETEERTVFYFSLVATGMSAVWMAFFDFHPIDLYGGLMVAGAGVFATLAQLAMTRAYKRGNTLVSASMAYSTVVFASLFGMWIWHENLSVSAWMAIALIVASGLVSTWFSRANPADQD